MFADAAPTNVVPAPDRFGRYRVFRPIASGGMATVYLGWLEADEGFVRPVAIKVMHPGSAADSPYAAMMLNEARIASRIRHANVVPVIDVVSSPSGPVLVLEYVAGASLAQVLRVTTDIPDGVIARLIVDCLEGLHAAHHATTEAGMPLEVVHRDVSPQNILLDETGIARITDFGVAKALERAFSTASGEVRGKIAYMAPEQLAGGAVDQRADLWGVGMVLWQLLTGTRPFADVELGRAMHDILEGRVSSPESVRACSPALAAVCMRALARDPDARFTSAREMAIFVERAATPAHHRSVAEWFRRAVRPTLDERAAMLADMERLARRERTARPATDAEGPTIHEGTMRLALDAPNSPGGPDGPGAAAHVSPVRRRALGVALALLAIASGLGAALVRQGQHASQRSATPEPPTDLDATANSAPVPSGAPSMIPSATKPAPSETSLAVVTADGSPSATGSAKQPPRAKPPARPSHPSRKSDKTPARGAPDDGLRIGERN